jgi:GT2 family glycosyltransferase
MPPSVTIAVLPREKFSCAARSLRSLIENTRQPFELIYVDGASPPTVRAEIGSILADVPHVMIRVDRYLGPFEALELALAKTTTPHLVIADNDIHFRSGWLDAMVACATEEDADVVTPLVLIGDERSNIIHVAGGTSRVVSEGAVRSVDHHQRFENMRVDDTAVVLAREPTELVESHCVLARTETLRALGPLDPSIGHAVNVEELSLGLARVGARVWFEPTAEVVYLFEKGMHLDRHDVLLLNHVWSEKWIERDLVSQARRHGLGKPPRAPRATIRWWYADHRRVWLSGVERRLQHLGERFGLPGVGRLLWKLFETVEVGGNRLFVACATRVDTRCRP